MKCEHCPAGWENRSYEGECDDYGCKILGYEICDDDCKLSRAEVEKRLKQLEEYEAGKIKRPQWIVNKFIRELDGTCIFNGEPSHVSYPPIWMRKGVYYPLYGPVDMHYQRLSDYREGYEDGKNGKEMKYV